MVTVPISKAAQVSEAISQVSGLSAVETISEGGDTARLRLVSAERQNHASAIADWLRSNDIPVDEMLVERGSLDEVFHTITEGDSHA